LSDLSALAALLKGFGFACFVVLKALNNPLLFLPFKAVSSRHYFLIITSFLYINRYFPLMIAASKGIVLLLLVEI